MMSEDLNYVKELALKYALYNAVKHDGKALLGPVISKIVAERPDLKPKIKSIISIVKEVIDYINSLSINEQKRLLEEKWPELLEEKVVERKHELPPLPNVEKYKIVVTRFAPNPDFVLHLGNARPAILCYEYAKMYKGKMILRFEDTDPRIKRPLPEAYDIIKEDLKWLGVKWDEEYIQSLRMEKYYEVLKELIRRGGAYVDLCSPQEFRKYLWSSKPCPHRNKPVEENLELLDKMLEGHFGEGEAVVRIKTDLNYPDPSVREWVAFRIIDTSKTPHPIVGDRYILWPTYNFAAAVDDHLMGVTHILRAKEHMTNTIKQKFLYKHMGWKYPEAIHFGRLKLEGFILSKSKMKELMESDKSFEGIDDIRFGTLSSLRKRGISPKAIHELIMEVGVKGTDAAISFDNLAAINRKIIDPIAPRYMFVEKPIVVNISNFPPELIAKIPYHPSNKELGERTIKVKGPQAEVYISSTDLELLRKHKMIRLMDLANIEITRMEGEEVHATFKGTSLQEARNLGLPIIQWVPYEDNVNVMVKKPKELTLEIIEGLSEPNIINEKEGKVVQFFRFGFVKLHSISKQEVLAYYTHD